MAQDQNGIWGCWELGFYGVVDVIWVDIMSKKGTRAD